MLSMTMRGAVGAAFHAWHALGAQRSGFVMDHAHWGPHFADAEIEAALRARRASLAAEQFRLAAESPPAVPGGKDTQVAPAKGGDAAAGERLRLRALAGLAKALLEEGKPDKAAAAFAAAFAAARVMTVAASEPYAANTLTVGATTLVSAAYPRTAERLAQAGVALRVIDVSELHKAESALTCMSLLLEPAAAAVTPAR